MDSREGVNRAVEKRTQKLMANLSLAYIGMKDGQRAYAALSKEDELTIGKQEILVCDMKKGKSKRTGLQNSAMYLYFEMLARKLNDSGFDMVATMLRMSKGINLPWTASAIKERLWRPVQIHTYKIESTSQLETEQVGVVYEALDRALTEKLVPDHTGVGPSDIHVEFPDKYIQMYERDASAKT